MAACALLLFSLEYVQANYAATADTILQVNNFELNISEADNLKYQLEINANVSRIAALAGINASTDFRRLGNLSSIPENGLASRASFRHVRFGSLFFGYSCMGTDAPQLKELAVRNKKGQIVYQFDETIQMLEMVVRAGWKPRLGLTGTPRAMVPEDAPLLTDPAYGCSNAPAINLAKETPRERMPEWWSLQDAFFKALIAHFGTDEISKWEFATWTEPDNHPHITFPAAIEQSGLHYPAVATLLAASIDAAIENGVSIRLGNFTGNVEAAVPLVVSEILRLPRGKEYLDYIKGISVSRYVVKGKPSDIRSVLYSAGNMIANPAVPNTPLFIDELGQLGGDNNITAFSTKPTLGGATAKTKYSLGDGMFLAMALETLFKMQNGEVRAPSRVNIWNNYLITLPGVEKFNQFERYLKTPVAHVAEMFDKMNGYTKVSSPLGTLVGVNHGAIKAILLTAPDNNGDIVRRMRLGAPSAIANRLVIHGLPPNRAYQVTFTEIGKGNGNPLGVFTDGVGDYATENMGQFVKTTKGWDFASQHWADCFYDQIAKCSWWDKAIPVNSPKITARKLITSSTGIIRANVGSFQSLVVMVDVVPVN